jgi:hypothetical protein
MLGKNFFVFCIALLQGMCIFATYYPDGAFDQFALALQDVAAHEVPVKKIPPKLPPRKPKEESQIVTQSQTPVTLPGLNVHPAPKAPTEEQLKVKKIELTREEEKRALSPLKAALVKKFAKAKESEEEEDYGEIKLIQPVPQKKIQEPLQQPSERIERPKEKPANLLEEIRAGKKLKKTVKIEEPKRSGSQLGEDFMKKIEQLQESDEDHESDDW